MWLLIIMFAFADGGGYHNGGRGGLSTETIRVASEEECHQVAKQVETDFKTKPKFRDIQTVDFKHQLWLAERLIVKHSCQEIQDYTKINHKSTR